MFTPVKNVALNTMKQDGEKEELEEAESEVKSEPPRKENNPPGAIIEPPRETELPTEPLTFSTTSDLLTSPMFKLGQHVLVCGAERGVVRFVSHTHFKDGVWMGVELERRKTKNDGSIDRQRYFTSSPGYGVFAPVRNVALLNEEEEEEKEKVTVTATKKEAKKELEEAESEVKNEPPRMERNPPGAIIDPPNFVYC